jgi:iron(III) transport system substrate-binding protein
VRRNALRLAATGFGFTIGSAAAQSQLNIICSVQLPWCEAVITQFQKDTAIKIGMTQKSAGER